MVADRRVGIGASVNETVLLQEAEPSNLPERLKQFETCVELLCKPLTDSNGLWGSWRPLFRNVGWLFALERRLSYMALACLILEQLTVVDGCWWYFIQREFNVEKKSLRRICATSKRLPCQDVQTIRLWAQHLLNKTTFKKVTVRIWKPPWHLLKITETEQKEIWINVTWIYFSKRKWHTKTSGDWRCQVGTFEEGRSGAFSCCCVVTTTHRDGDLFVGLGRGLETRKQMKTRDAFFCSWEDWQA